MYSVYILKSVRDNNFYVGYTTNLKQRFKFHEKGKVKSTRNRIPLKLIYYEVCLNQKDALKREKYLKSNYGNKYLKNILKEYLNNH